MRLAIVVQRYGEDVNGGAELQARLFAERVAPFVQVEVLTTTARDYMTWENAYAPGLTAVNGVPVRRFAVHTRRDVPAFNRLSERLLAGPHSHYDEVAWMAAQGPDAPDLFAYLRDAAGSYDLFLFFTYLYATTYLGLPLVAHKSALWPTAHDEPWIHLDLFRSVFNLPRALAFNSPEEAAFVRQRFHNGHIPGAVLGTGIEVPARPPRRMLEERYILYMGRIDESKGCGELFDYFLHYKAQTHDPVKLVLVGGAYMPVPAHPDIVAAGFIPGAERFDWLQSAELLVLPSRYESLSLVTLEAMALGVPVLVQGASPVLRGHCTRSKAGLYYGLKTDFALSLRLMLSNQVLRTRFGECGRNYVRQHYDWSVMTERYVEFLRATYDRVIGSTVSSPG